MTLVIESPFYKEMVVNLSDRHTHTAQDPKPAQAGELLTHTHSLRGLEEGLSQISPSG